MLDIQKETPVSLFEVAEKFNVTVTTVRKWTNPNKRHHLETAKIGGKRFTTWEAVQRFVEPDNPEAEKAAIIRASHERAMKVLRELHGF